MTCGFCGTVADDSGDGSYDKIICSGMKILGYSPNYKKSESIEVLDPLERDNTKKTRLKIRSDFESCERFSKYLEKLDSDKKKKVLGSVKKLRKIYHDEKKNSDKQEILHKKRNEEIHSISEELRKSLEKK
ncbi:hypothetical protein COB64_02820 [Candidatus Wolfebacteria bacterium]|nr:MAG: hypothetical protein COB64_02820 [Candidatus Wolfebacteria bacterium]